MLVLLVWVVRGFGWFAGGLRFGWLDLVAGLLADWWLEWLMAGI